MKLVEQKHVVVTDPRMGSTEIAGDILAAMYRYTDRVVRQDQADTLAELVAPQYQRIWDKIRPILKNEAVNPEWEAKVADYIQLMCWNQVVDAITIGGFAVEFKENPDNDPVTDPRD